MVYRAMDRQLLRPVAVKVFPATLTRPERFLREATLLATLRHENLVPIYQAGQTAEAFYLVMELVEGEPLSRWATPGERNPLPLMLDVASALEEVHQAGLVHRDVKPGNVQVGPQGQGILLDLGCVYDASGATLTRTGMVLGTAVYLPPEAFRGAPPNPSWDWYGWGATLYVCLEGEVAYRVAELMEYAKGSKLPPLKIGAATRRAGLERLVRACLDQDDRARPSSRAELEELAGARARPSTTQRTRPAPLSSIAPAAPVPAGPAPRRWWGPPLALLLLGLGALGWATGEGAPAPSEPAPSAPPPAFAPPPLDWSRERGGNLLLPSPDTPVTHRLAAPCLAENGEALVSTGSLWMPPGGGLFGHFQKQLLSYRETPLGVVTRTSPSRPILLLPGAGEEPWVLHPRHLETEEAPPTWESTASPRAESGCLEMAPVAGAPDHPLAWQVAGVLLPAERATPALPSSVGPWWVHDVGPDRRGGPRRFAFSRAGDATPPRIHAFDEEAGWWPSAAPIWDPGRKAAVFTHRHKEKGLRVRAIEPETGAVAYQRGWAGRQDWGTALFADGLYFFDGTGVWRTERDRDPGDDRLLLTDDPEWIAPYEDAGVRLLATPAALHVFVPHRVMPGTAGKEVPVLSWYRLAHDLSGPTPPRPWRLRLPRPPEAVFLEERAEVTVLPIPGRPDQVLVAVQMGWTRYELLVLDLRRARIHRRIDVAPGDELTDSGYLRTRPIVAMRDGHPRVCWVDIWGVLKVVDLR